MPKTLGSKPRKRKTVSESKLLAASKPIGWPDSWPPPPLGTRVTGKTLVDNTEYPILTVELTPTQRKHYDEALTGKDKDRIRHAAARTAERKWEKAYNKIHGHFPGRGPYFLGGPGLQ
jgi:hypothetical protein